MNFDVGGCVSFEAVGKTKRQQVLEMVQGL